MALFIYWLFASVVLIYTQAILYRNGYQKTRHFWFYFGQSICASIGWPIVAPWLVGDCLLRELKEDLELDERLRKAWKEQYTKRIETEKEISKKEGNP